VSRARFIHTEAAKPIPSKRLDRQIHEAALQYNWDDSALSDLYDSEKEKIRESDPHYDDPLLRMVLLCRARSPDWERFFKKAITYADFQRYHQRRSRFIISEGPAATETRNGLYAEMISRLIDPLTMEPFDPIGVSNRRFAREVADGLIQISYI
jgi:hypothetical protein